MDPNDASIRVLDELAKHLRVGLAIIDSDFRLRWTSQHSRAWLALPAIADGNERLPDAIRLAAERPDGGTETAWSFEVEGPMGPLFITRLCTLDATEDSLLWIEDRECAERAAAHVRSAARCGDFKRLVRSFHHDIRTPLNALNLQIALMERSMTCSPTVPDGGDGEREKAHFDSLRRDVKRIDRITGEFAAPWCSQESAQAKADLCNTVESAIEELRPPFRLSFVRCELRRPNGPVVLLLRHDLVHHALINLLLGALDRHDLQVISVAITVERNSVRIVVPRPPMAEPVSSRSPGEWDRRTLEAIRRETAIQDLEAAGARVMATEHDDSTWYEIEFTTSD